VTGPLAVVGAINVDLVVSGAALPAPGETTVGGVYAEHHGGKGGNQAVAAARALGVDGTVAMVGAVGADAFGAGALDALRSEGVDVTAVRTVDAATGVALIVVDGSGENQIVVAPGANHAFDDITTELDQLRPSLVLLSCEISYRAAGSAARWCETRSVPLILNPAPATHRLRNLLGRAHVVTPNRGEVLELSPGITDPIEAARAMYERFEGLTIVITLGEDGAFVSDAGGQDLIDAPHVDAVDSVGAGDCLNGVLAAALWQGLDPRRAVRRAVVAAALSVGVAGAREGMPTRDAIDAALGA
jgi:ribokinase